MIIRRLIGLAFATAALAGCATAPKPLAPPAPPQPVPAPAPPAPPTQDLGSSPAGLPGWAMEDHRAALSAFAAGCGRSEGSAPQAACSDARALWAAGPTPDEARTFFETRFAVQEVRRPDGEPGLLTAYFAPEYPARKVPDETFDTPVLAAPADLERQGGQVVQRLPDGSTRPYPARAAIEAAPTPSTVLAWMTAEDLFFLQIQGSGYLTFEDGTAIRAAYAADNGRPFVGIARPMAERGLLPRDGASGEAIRGWLAEHRGAEARAVMALNPRYIFFRADPDDGGQPNGAAGVPLPPRRAIAVDPAHWRYGEPVWVSANGARLAGARSGYQGLVMALDTGSAIRGPVRADFYMGRGEAAGAEAGTVRHPLRMWRLIPR